MADDGDDAPANETPMQKALRLKKVAQAKAAGVSGRQRDGGIRAAAAHSASKSKPWMKK